MKILYKGTIVHCEPKMTIREALKKEIKNSEYPVIGAIYNNEYVGLNEEIDKDGEIKLIDISTKEGMRIYRRTVLYILGKAFRKVYPGHKMTANYQLSNAMYCEIDDGKATEDLVKKLNEEMRNIIKANLPITKTVMTKLEADEFYKKYETSSGKLQYEIPNNDKIYTYYCEDYFNYCYGILADKTGITKIFEIIKYDDGFLMRYPSASKPGQLPKLIQSKKIKWVLNEYDDIHRILDLKTVYQLNQAVATGNIKDVIMLDEALHEKKIANIADKVAKNRKIKMILIAGPSSSGKTTFAQRLGIQLRINKIKPVTISIDNYFVERKDNPRDENGNYDFECIEAIDLNLFNDHLIRLLNGEEVEVPQFDFHEGVKKYNGTKLKLEKDEVLVIEGIHGLNDKLTSSIPKNQKYKVYISALTVLNMDRYSRISSTDTRLMRRIVRDHQFRGYSAKSTIDNWPSVNRGEEKYIFPFQEKANTVFNTSLIYELGVLKGLIKPILEEITQDEPQYAEAQRLLEMLQYVRTISPEAVPTNSLLKEFIGGGDFKY